MEKRWRNKATVLTRKLFIARKKVAESFLFFVKIFFLIIALAWFWVCFVMLSVNSNLAVVNVNEE